MSGDQEQEPKDDAPAPQSEAAEKKEESEKVSVEEAAAHDAANDEDEGFEDEPTRSNPRPAGIDDLFPTDDEPAAPGDDDPTRIHEPAAATDEGSRLISIVESLLFAADKPLGLQGMGDLLGEKDLGKVRAAVATVEDDYRDRGIQLHSVAGGYQFRTNPANATWVQKLLAQKPVRLTRAQLETLAIVAYRQPITRPEIDEIRGVDSGGTLKTLMDRMLIRILGKKEEPGRPMLYGSTREFLEFFNLGDLKDLPTLREFHELSEEHQAQVAALESVAPEGTIDAPGTPEDPNAAPPPKLERVELTAPPEDSAELDEIDRLISTANTGGPPPKPEVAGEGEGGPGDSEKPEN